MKTAGFNASGRAPVFVLCALCAVFLSAQQNDEAAIAAYSDPARVWGNGVERIIEEAYRICFKTRILGGRVMNLRMPFAQNNERDKLTSEEWGFVESGKGNPARLWDTINEVLDSGDFALYAETLSDNREKVIIFDIPGQSWTASRDVFDIARMKAGSYGGLPHRPLVLVSGRGLEETGVYNYLYCVGRVGMDCSGFVWHILSSVAAQGGTDLGRTLARLLGVKQGENPSWYAGADFYNTKTAQIIAVDDRISALRPADVLLFRGAGGTMVHSAVVQSVDLTAGVVRYLQCTDEAPPAERGVHESFIRFNPANPNVSLKDPSLDWTQERYPPFPGEKSRAFSNDGERFRAYPEHGGGRAVRLRAVSAAIDAIGRH